MNSLNFGMVSTCTITRKTSSGSDELGQPTYTTSTKTASCAFDTTSVSGAGGGWAPGPDPSGRFIVGTPYVFLPPTTDIKIGDIITSGDPEFAGPYEVVYIKRVTEIFTTAVDHLEAFLNESKKGA